MYVVQVAKSNKETETKENLQTLCAHQPTYFNVYFFYSGFFFINTWVHFFADSGTQRYLQAAAIIQLPRLHHRGYKMDN